MEQKSGMMSIEAHREEMRKQMKVAEFAYMHRPAKEIAEDPMPEKIDGNTVMRWWLKKGLAAEWGRYVESLKERHNDPDATPIINVDDEDQLAHIVEELRGGKNTLH